MTFGVQTVFAACDPACIAPKVCADAGYGLSSCVDPKANGSPCSENFECASGSCKDAGYPGVKVCGATTGAGTLPTDPTDTYTPGPYNSGTYSPASPVTTGSSGVKIPTKAETGLSDKTIAEILTQLLNWLLEIVGIIAIIGFVISGIMYLVSAGNEEMITKAKKYMLYCLIGIIVALASFVVIKTIDSILNANIGGM